MHHPLPQKSDSWSGKDEYCMTLLGLGQCFDAVGHALVVSLC